MYLYILF